MRGEVGGEGVGVERRALGMEREYFAGSGLEMSVGSRRKSYFYFQRWIS